MSITTSIETLTATPVSGYAGDYTAQWMGNTRTQRLALGSSLSLRYLKTGSGAPLLLIHTLRTQLDYFQKIIPALSRRFTVYALDLPGHGHSSIEASDYSEPYLRTAVIRFIEALALDDLTIAGESIGAVLALTAASELSSRIEHVYALNPYDYGKSFGGGIRRSSIWGNLIIGSFGVPGVGVISSHLENRFLLRRVLNGGLIDSENLSDHLLLEFNRVGGRKGYRRVERSTFSHWRSWHAARESYSRITTPVTLIYGQQDWSLPEERSANADLLSPARVITMEDARHFLSLERPDKVVDIITAGVQQ